VDKKELMKAIIQDAYGPVDGARAGDIPRPEPSAGEVLVRVRAAGADRACGT
jgi:NADPH:quinone reductase-like Zn-dependent oxidoreductase